MNDLKSVLHASIADSLLAKIQEIRGTPFHPNTENEVRVAILRALQTASQFHIGTNPPQVRGVKRLIQRMRWGAEMLWLRCRYPIRLIRRQPLDTSWIE
jgi:hypothetical protein